MNLEIAKCCGTCIHCNKPKRPTEHEAHYMVAKTERWCYLNNIKTTRECVCDCYEIDNKKGGVPACKRIFKFNERAERILTLVKAMNDNHVEKLETTGWNPTTYVVRNGWLYIEHQYKRITGEIVISYYKVDSCSADFDRIEKILWQILNEKKKQKGDRYEQ